jgi:PAS domain-containing protein
LIHIFGGLPYAALPNAHEAEAEILQITPEDEAGKEFEKVLVQARLHLKPGDPRLVHLEWARRRADGQRGDPNYLDPWLKYLAADALHAANKAEGSEKSRLRDFVKMVRLHFVTLTFALGLTLISILSVTGATENNEDLRDILRFTPALRRCATCETRRSRTVYPDGCSS